MEAEFNEIENRNLWPVVYQEIRNEALRYNYSNKESKKCENKSLNRYRDVTPYDHSRIQLIRGQNSYINASLIKVESVDRSYILTQGPLSSTVSHFWCMIWEQNSKAILMLNRLVERGTVKCHQYWPNGKENDDIDELVFEDVSLNVEFLNMEKRKDFIIRHFLLTDLKSGQSRNIIQYHYNSWPDFGLPESPASFLEFLLEVRKSGALDITTFGSPVVHCSAGIGRSGTLCLVDVCLVLIARSKSMDSVNVRQILLDMRKYRMGLIQTHEQLRFSYMSIIQGAKSLLSNDNGSVPSCTFEKSPNAIQRISCNENQNEVEESDKEEERETIPLPMPPKNKKFENNQSINERSLNTTGTSSTNNNKTLLVSPAELRYRARGERNQKTIENIKRIKDKQKQIEERSRLKKTILKMSGMALGIALVVGTGFMFYNNYLTTDISPISHRSS